jgi:glycosyltransferase involved in cell wall biosynthesis
MSRILIFGLSPLPFENERRMYGPGIRTWQFAEPLLADGHDVRLVTMRIGGAYEEAGERVRHRQEGRLDSWSLDEKGFKDLPFLQKLHDDFAPDAVVGATAHASSVAVRISTDRPVWADVFGDLMAEAQAKAFVYDNDHYLIHFWDMLRPILDRADIFSGVSNRQCCSLVGALGVRGRLNKHSHGYLLVHHVPCGMSATPFTHEKTVLRGIDAAPGDFVLLWSGGYNTWTDVETLFAALEIAMERDHRVRFASTGGQIDGHDERTYPRFRELIAGSRFRERYLLRGWLPTQDVPNYYFEADAGIHIDRPIYERILGSENRVLDWMRAGLPIVCSDVSELAEQLDRDSLGVVYRSGDAAGLAGAILRLVEDPLGRREMARRANAWALENLTFERTTEPLRRWANAPLPSPDRGRRIPLERCEIAPVRRPLRTRFYLSMKSEGLGSALRKTARWLWKRVR